MDKQRHGITSQFIRLLMVAGLGCLLLFAVLRCALRFTLTARDLSYYDPEMGGWYAAPGRYAVLIGHSSRNIPAVLPLNFVTSRARPLTIDENTAMGDLLRDARTAPILQKALAPVLQSR